MNVAELLAADLTLEPTAGRIYGVTPAVVTSTDDPDALGRVKVRYPWLGDDVESPWARVMSPMAGKERGIVFRPEVGDEVLVLFEHGDVRFPYVIGGVWSAADPPPEHGPDGDNHIRLIRSRSGHEIVLDDSPGAEKIVIADRSGEHRIELSSSGIVIESSAIRIGGAGASESLVLGDAFMALFNAHTHPTGVGPSGPPTQQMTPGTHLSSQHKTV
ncbi:MAG TPA: phage baseplate assembly protein V [Longimicrobiales bacterium]